MTTKKTPIEKPTCAACGNTEGVIDSAGCFWTPGEEGRHVTDVRGKPEALCHFCFVQIERTSGTPAEQADWLTMSAEADERSAARKRALSAFLMPVIETAGNT